VFLDQNNNVHQTGVDFAKLVEAHGEINIGKLEDGQKLENISDKQIYKFVESKDGGMDKKIILEDSMGELVEISGNQALFNLTDLK